MQHPISLKNVRVHNLKGVNLQIEPNQLVVFTGVSGSGKSSLAFDTIYVEGQRRYVESLSNQVRAEIGDYAKPELDSADGITPTIAIEQKSRSHNPRSTVGTLTEIYDYLRVLYARIGIPHCPVSGEPLSAQSKERIIANIQTISPGTKVILLAPYVRDRKGEFKEELKEFVRKGFMRVRIDGTFHHLENPITLDGNVNHTIDIVIDRTTIGKENKGRIIESVSIALDVGKGLMSLYFPDKEEEQLFSVHAFSEASQISYEPLDPQDFSFNHPQGMCPTCFGLGELETFDIDQVIDPDKSIAQDCCSVGSSYETVRYGNIYRFLAEKYRFSVNTPWKKLSKQAQEIFLFGIRDKWLKIPFVHPKTGHVWVDHIRWDGVLKEAMRRYSEAKSEGYRKNMQALMTKGVCPECQGSRLKPYPAVCRFGDKTITEITNTTIGELVPFFAELKLTKEDQQIGGELLQEITARLGFLNHVGLHYLTLNRASPTLSGGEAQRVRLASQIGSGLVGITYVLDEPSIGLHPRDNHQLIETLKHLRNLGNTVLVVEHDEETIFAADHVIDVGPGPGYKGGQIIVDGSLKDLLSNKQSLTGAYLRGDLLIASPKERRKPKKEAIEILGACHNNLKNVDVKIPLGLFVAITGVSGSGKSSLILETLFPVLSNTLHKGEHVVGKHKTIKGIEHVDKVIAIDQTPIGRNPRSNPSTYIKLFDLIRDLFAMLPEAQAKGFKKGQFSFNVKEGSCTTCGGMGMIKVDMDFLDDAFITCPTCEGQRFDPATLSILYKGHSIADILNMEVSQALQFFEHLPQIYHCLDVLHRVGLDYLKLGQPSPTLSGGEAQRVKLAKELLRPSTGKTVYILDEPTTGLHFADIKQLMGVLHHFVEEGNTVIVIEHNMDVVKGADWVIDLGPEGGKGGGQILSVAPPEKIAQENSPTGKALKHMYETDQNRKKIAAEILGQKISKKTIKPLVDKIAIKGASQNNLKNVTLEIPRNQITAFCGPSGSGKSSLAFETIYAEGQRKYAESLSAYARQFIKQMPRPHVEMIEGLSPAIAIEQKIHAGNPRSTVGTMTEVYDYLRILWAHLGIPHNPDTKNRLISIEPETIVEEILRKPEGTKLQVLAPYEIKRSETLEDIASQVKRLGYLRIYLNGKMYHLDTPESSTETIPFDPKQKNSLFIVIDRLLVKKENSGRIREAVYAAVKVGEKKLAFLEEDELKDYYLDFADPVTGESFPPVTPKTFGFNTLEGACPNCQGLGTEYGCNVLKEEEVQHLSFYQMLEFITDLRIKGTYQKILESLLKKIKIQGNQPLISLPAKALETLLKGSDWIEMPNGKGSFQWSGIEPFLAIAAKHSETKIKEILEPLMENYECSTCHGDRLNRHASAVLIQTLSLPNFCRLPIDEAKHFIEKIDIADDYLKDVKEAILNRLRFLEKIGLSYLSLDRKAPTLSGGETQRIRLARQLGSGLTGALYVLDEPTIGLHPRDTDRMNGALLELKEKGNTLIVVEHDPQTLQISDYLVDFGPGSGRKGGEVTAQGALKQILKNPNSLTGQYLTGKKSVLQYQKNRPLPKEWISIKNGTLHNIKGLHVKFPVGLLTCITGVSGSGKSTLIHDILAPLTDLNLKENKNKTPLGEIDGLESFEQMLKITQDPIGLTSRSDVGTYTEVLPKIRELYAMLPDATMRGLQPKNFSYNHLKGMCTNCWGMGYKKVELLFLPSVKVKCDVCQGMRLNPLSLEVRYQGKSFGEILQMTIQEAALFFANHKRIKNSLDILAEVGLDYVQLGQEMGSLSGGEAQRIKLSRELAKRSRGKTLFLLDEPTIGLHPEDILKLLSVLQKIVDKGHTIIVIEHNLDIMASSDYLIDMGPEAGQYGGEVVAQGVVDKLIHNKYSYTAKYLKEHLKL